ncbi:bacteriohemerythrin, partial [candidate division KSB1 bacterium]
MPEEIKFCCSDLRNFVNYLNTLDNNAAKRIITESEQDKFKPFKVCPFCIKDLSYMQVKLDKSKTYKLDWDENLGIGIPWIDNQHKKLLERINILINAIIKEDSSDEVGKSIRFMQNYVKAHFGTEEALMLKHQYPKLDFQRKQHKYFMKRIDEFSRQHESAGASKDFIVNISRELWNWFKGHILKADNEFGEF